MNRVITAITEHLEDEAFGVAELAEEMSMSRSTLLRRIKSATGLSAALFIRQQRLLHAKGLLQEGSLTISEIAYKTGFSSSSYFTKCFREEYGYPPGEEHNQHAEKEDLSALSPFSEKATLRPNIWVLAFAGILILAIGLTFFLWPPSQNDSLPLPKTIAVLPFQNDSPDSSNIYLINGLMATIIDNLHKIEDLQVTSRTTVERYRGMSRTIPELAEELGVSYFVEGSGQKIGDQILLTLRLVDAHADTLIWSRRYKRETTDIFQLQAQVSRSIAQEIEVIITPEEQRKLAVPPTDNLVAYDHYLKGLDQIQKENREELIKGISSFKKAIKEDPNFAQSHAYLAISYYFLDLFQVDKNHTEDINTHADKAILLDPSLNESLIGKALYYMQAQQYELAIQYFDKVLAKSPDLGWVHNLLSTIYTFHLPDTEQYLFHAIQGIQYGTNGQDSTSISMTYLHLSNALTQNGFLKEAETYLEKSLDYHADNIYAGILSVYVQLGQDNNLKQAYKGLNMLLAKDTLFLPTLQELGKVALYFGDLETAWHYYERFQQSKEAAGLNIYPDADINIAYILEQMGRTEEAMKYKSHYHSFIQKDNSAYQELGLAVYYASLGKKELAISSLNSFAEGEAFQYWMVMFIDQVPFLQTLSNDPAYALAIQRIKDSFWEQHRRLRSRLEAEGAI